MPYRADDISLRVNNRRWYISPNVLAVFLTALLMHLVVIGWVASKYDSRITEQEARVTVIARDIKTDAEGQRIVLQRLANIEGKLEFLITATKDKQR